METFIGVSSGIAYLFLAGVIYQAFLRWRRNQCKDCQGPIHRQFFEQCYSTHEIPAFLIAIAWPATLFIVGGTLCADWLGSRDKRHEAKEVRAQAKHERVMAEMTAETEKMRTNIAFLKANGVNAEVDGL